MKKVKISWREIHKGVVVLEKKIKQSKWPIKNIYGIPRGGLVLAVMLSHRLDIPLVVDLRSVNKNTLVVDEIADSGKTLLKLMSKKKVGLIASLYTRKTSLFIPQCTAFKLVGKEYLVFPWEV